MSKDSLGIIGWIGLLVLIFIIVVYFKGFTSDVGSLGSSVTDLVSQLQGHPSNTAKNSAAGVS